MKDNGGNENTVILSDYTMTVNTVNPTIEGLTSPTPDAVYTADPVLTFTATDPAPGTEVSCAYKIDSGSPVSVPCTGTDRTISGLFDGRHSVVVTATDQANNVINSSAVSFVYNNDHTLTVCKTGTPDFATIQAAVNAATAGDTVSVCAETYNEEVVIGKPLILQGEGRDNTTIGKSVKVSSNSVVLTGFKIVPSPILGEIVGVYLQGNLDAVEVKNNEIDGTEVSGSTRGVVTTIGNSFVGVTIENNKIHHVVSGIYTNSHTGVIVIKDNEIYNTTAGIGGLTGAEVRGNTFHNNGEDIGVDNTITGSTYVIEKNTILDNVNTYGGASVNVSKNWWGTAYKPTIQSRVSGSVTFEPYYVDAAMTILSDVPVSIVNVDDDFTEVSAGGGIYGYNAFSKIQEGVDKVAASGTVNVAAGTYDEDVAVNTPGVAIQAVTRHEAVVEGTIVITANNVTVDGFSVRTFSRIPTPDWSGIYIQSGTNILVTNNLIDGTGIDPIANLTVGIHTLYGATAGATLEGNIVRNVRLGIYNQGALLLISKNTIENTAHCAIGVDTSLGTTITENIISNTSLGVEVFKDNVIANHNNITGTTGFGVWSAGPQVDAKTNWWGSPTGPAHPTNPGGSGDAVSNHVTYSPWCTAVPSGNPLNCPLGSSDPLHHYAITALPADSVTMPGPIILTITAKDASDITRVNDGSQITLSANKPVSFVPDYILNLVNGVRNDVNVSYSGVGDVNVRVTGTVASTKLLTFTALPDTSDHTAPPSPVITTLPATVNADFYTINGTAGAALPVDSSRTIRLFNGSVLAGTTILDVGQTAWSIVVSLNQEVNNVFKATSTDTSGNASVDSATVTINEHFNDTALLAVTGVSATQSLATANDSWEHGWHWTFYVTVPTVESSLSMQFSDWTGTAGTILVAGNTRFYSAQSDHNSVSPVVIEAANTYTGPMQLTGDLDPSTPGRQIQIMVETKVPPSAAGGSYSASYGVKTSVPVIII